LEPVAPNSYVFRQFLLEPSEHRLTRNGEEVPLRPKTFEVLVYLVEHYDHRVTKEELLAAIWPDVFVTDKVLRNSIWEIREALKRTGEEDGFIKTIPKVGYQFVGDVKEIPAEINGTKPKPLIAIIGAVCFALLAFFLWYFGLLFPKASIGQPKIDSIAVLPFTSTAEDEETQSLAFALASSVGSSLSRLGGPKIVPAAALMRYRGQEIDPEIVSDELDVSTILMGSVARVGEVFSVTVNLIEGREGTQIWGDTYRKNINEVLAVDEAIVQQVANALSIYLTQEQSQHLVRRGTDNLEAYRALSLGEYRRSLWFRGNLEEKIHEAIGHWKRAVELDPGYQEAYWRLADSYFFLVARRAAGPDEYYAIARTYFEKAVEIDPTTRLGHRAKARILWSYDRKWEDAEKEYQKAAQLERSFDEDPTRTVVEGRSFLEWMGHREELLSHAERELERMDPKSARQHLVFAYHFFWLGDWDRALRLSHETLSLESDQDLHLMHWIRSICYERLGMEKRAFEEILKMFDGEQRVAEMQKVFDEEGLAGVRPYRFEESGRNRALPRAFYAMRYAEAGEIDKALDCLEQMWSLPLEGWEHAPSNRLYDPLRSDPRFEQLLRRQNLPEEAIQRHLSLN